LLCFFPIGLLIVLYPITIEKHRKIPRFLRFSALPCSVYTRFQAVNAYVELNSAHAQFKSSQQYVL
jgi:hypothetical protein